MARESTLLRSQRWYGRVLRLYPKSFRERFEESMQQTFRDVCRAHVSNGQGLLGLTLWLCLDTLGGIMKEHIRLLTATRRRILRAAVITVAVLLIPLWGVFYVQDWNWDWHGFLVAGVFVFTGAMTYEVVGTTMTNAAYRGAVILAVVTAFVLTAMNFVLAVDVNLFNFMYFVVVLIGLVGAAVARLRPRGMALALLAMAIGQMLVPLIALIFWNTRLAPGGPFGAFGLNGVCIILFGMSALLFRRAARTHEMRPTALE